MRKIVGSPLIIAKHYSSSPAKISPCLTLCCFLRLDKKDKDTCRCIHTGTPGEKTQQKEKLQNILNMTNHLSGTTIGTVRRRRSGRGTRRTTQVFEEFFIWIQNEWMDFLVWGVTLHLFESFSHPRPRMEVFSLSLHL